MGFSKISLLPEKQNTKLVEDKWLCSIDLVFTSREYIFRKKNHISPTITKLLKGIWCLVSASESPWGCGLWGAVVSGCVSLRSLCFLSQKNCHFLTITNNFHFHVTEFIWSKELDSGLIKVTVWCVNLNAYPVQGNLSGTESFVGYGTNNHTYVIFYSLNKDSGIDISTILFGSHFLPVESDVNT